MKVLVVIVRSPAQRFLVDIRTDELVKQIKRLILKKRHSQAIVTALSKGSFEKEVLSDELPEIKADLILTEHNAHWDIVK